MEVVPIVIAGLAVGVVFGLFGAGGSAFATPVLALLGVPPVLALASPLPALLPASLAGARQYHRSGLLDRHIALLAVLSGVPAVVAGAVISQWLGGQLLLVLSGALLGVVGLRMAWPANQRPRVPTDASRGAGPGAAAPQANTGPPRTGLVVAASAGVGLVTGLLANGGGFLLVPMFVLVLGLSSARAAGTSMVAVAALSLPTLAAHAALGHVDWAVAGAFAAGLVPASVVGARWGGRLPDPVARPAFGAMMVLFSAFFLIRLFT